ncbi:MAG: SEC-C domain-containing protein, partial [Candidatus Omnitrophica bacterium]|nr:SEC-C domain-containing protein [Candidatus Omnitrophota bacterium]
DSFPNSLPVAWESGGRIASIMKKYSIKEEATMHINKYAKNSICLCPSPARITMFEEGKVDLTNFFNKLITPYFYGLSYFEQYGIWPWGAYSHGYLGILEFYFEEMQGKPSNREMLETTLIALDNVNKAIVPLITTGEFFKVFKNCPCGSGRVFKECHFVQYHGARILACDYKILKEGFGKIQEVI